MRFDFALEIDRPVEDVFAYLTAVERLPEWQASAVEARWEDEPVRVGSRMTEVRKFMGRRAESTLEVTEYEPNRRFALRVVSGPVPYRVDHTFEALDGRTRIVFRGEGEPGRYFKLAQGMVARAAERQFKADFANLKTVLESRA